MISIIIAVMLRRVTNGRENTTEPNFWVEKRLLKTSDMETEEPKKTSRLRAGIATIGNVLHAEMSGQLSERML